MRLQRSSNLADDVQRLFDGASVATHSGRHLLDRLVAARDPVAFEAIVQRHGPMVARVCRAVLTHPTDIDDAFQATFLILVQKAATLRDGDQLSPWLHGVARRVTLRVRAISGRRRGRKATNSEFVATAPDRPVPTAETRELAALIHAEVDRLSLAERSAILLCDLEGLSHQEAADQLGWPLGTVKTRVNRGRERLRARLSRRGVTLGASAVAAALASEAVAAAIVPRTLVVVTTRAALAVVAGRTFAVGLVSAPVFSLTQGAVRAMIFTKFKALAVGLTMTTVALAVPGVVAYQAQQPKPDSDAAQSPRLVGDDRAEAVQAAPADKATGKMPTTVKKNTGGSPATVANNLQAPSVVHLGTFEPGGSPATEAMNLAILRKLEEANPLKKSVSAYQQSARPELSFKGLARLISESTVDPDAGLPKGIPVVFTSEGDRLAQGRLIDLDRLASDDDPTPLRVVLTKTARLFGLGYRVSGGKLVFDADSDASTAETIPPVRVRARALDDEERNEAIQAKLDQVVPMRFPEKVALTNLLAYVKKATQKPDGKAIPIYVDPNALEALKNPPTEPREETITIDLDDVPLRTSLRLALRQINLDYNVSGGVLIIGNMQEIENLSKLSGPFSTPGGMGGGMGRMGGMM